MGYHDLNRPLTMFAYASSMMKGTASGSWRRMAAHFVRLLIFTVLTAVAVPAGAQSTSTFSNTTSGTINGTTVCTTPLVRTFAVGSNFTVADVNIGILATHGWRGDLQFTLQSPTGTRVQLTNGDTQSISGDNFNVLLDDAATQLVNTDGANRNHSTSAPPYQNTYQPRSLLSAFDGETSAGTIGNLRSLSCGR